ncbi:MAG: efflux RND transporter permease subunit [Gammaproteobacteria bacterium]|nr:efflux RND transporter permease subunit [Gammaproteobacteria bacterium]MDE0513345.1 efflux RND transporter permease subunit [Gammaproteobacteria bacterium]
MFRFAIEKPLIIAVAVLIICLFGLLAIFRVPIQMIPDLDVRVVTVITQWPGATPQDVEKEIIIEQEEYLRRIPGLERMISQARTGRAEIELEFPYGVEINEVLIRVNNALTQVPGYPENVDEPRLVTSTVSNNPFLFFLARPLPGNPQNVNMVEMRDFLEDNVRVQIERVPGVSDVRIWGGAERQIKVYVEPVKLAERQITLSEVRNAIRARNRDVSGGDLDSGKRRYLLRTVGRFSTTEDIENMVIAHRDGVFIRLRDLGYAELSTFEIQSYSYANGTPNISLGVRRQIGSNVVEVKEDVVKKVEQLNDGLLRERGLYMVLNADDVKYVTDSVVNVRKNLVIGAFLATAVLFLFLRTPSATLIGAVGIPICTLAAFLGLLVSGRTINVISLAGVAFAIGMTLDNSIVVLENIYRHMASGKQRRRAAIDGVTEVWPALLASTLTTVLVFLPIIFIKQEAGQLYSDIAVAISASILMSLLVATLVVPTLCSRFLTPNRVEMSASSGLYAGGQRFGAALLRFVNWLMETVARRLALVAVVACVTLLIFASIPKAEYLPEGEEPKMFVQMYAPPGYNIDEMHGIFKDLEAYLLPYVGQDPELYARRESGLPGLKYVIGYASASRNIVIPEVTDIGQANDLLDLIVEKIREIPGVHAFASRGSIFSSNWGGSRSINLELSGADLVPLFDAGLKAFVQAQSVFENPQIRPEPSTLALGQPLVEVRPDWERASELGLDVGDLGYSIWAFSDGAFVDEFFLGDEKIDIFLYSTQGTIRQPEDVADIMLYSPTGGMVPLSAVAAVRQTVNTETIRRVDSSRTITLGIVPPRDIPLEQGVDMVRRGVIDELRASGEIGDDIAMRITGASDLLSATRNALKGNFIVAVFISYLLLVAIFSHWGYPLLVMTTVPVGIGGGLIGLWLLNAIGGNLSLLGLSDIYQPFDVITMLGFLILIGTVVNNPILIIDRTMRNVRTSGMASIDAVMESVRARLRPIMISSITTIFGLSPLVFSPGAGTELYRGLGAIVMFGLLFSTLITLTFMPTLLSLTLQFRERLVPSADKLSADYAD